jgi:hypothetical protein
VVAVLAGAFFRFVRLFMPRRRPVDRRATQVSIVARQMDGTQRAVVLYGDRVGGMIHKGDIVEVHGRLKRDGVIYAKRVDIVGAQYASGSVPRRTISGDRKLPLFVPLAVWLVVIGVWGYFFLPPLLRLAR